MATTERSGRSMSTVCLPQSSFVLHEPNKSSDLAQSRFLVSGSADNTLRLWSVQSGKCLYKWEFPTAVKSVAFNETDDQVVCITEQRMGYQGAIRVFNVNRDGDGTRRLSLNQQRQYSRVDPLPLQRQANRPTCLTPSGQKLPSVHFRTFQAAS